MIRLEGVSKGYGSDASQRRVLSNLDLDVAAGEIVAMAGPSGSGKTTVLALIAGWSVPDVGQVTVIDDSMNPAGRHWSDVAVVPQSLGLLPELTIGENITLSMTAGRVPAGPIDEITDLLGITHLVDRSPDEVSLGEQQRAAVARAAVARPRVLIADEPIAHQNHALARVVMGLIADLARAGTAVLIATHNELAFDSCDRILRMTDGRLVADTS